MPLTNRPQTIYYVDSGVAASGNGLSWATAFRTLAEIGTALSGNRESVGVLSKGTFRENLQITNAQNITWVADSVPGNQTILNGALTSGLWYTVDLTANIYGLTGVPLIPNTVVYDYKQDGITGPVTGIILPPERAINGQGVFYGHLNYAGLTTTPSSGRWGWTGNTIYVNPPGLTPTGLANVRNLTEYGRGWTGSGFDAGDNFLNGIYLSSCVGCTFAGFQARLWTAPSPNNKQIGYSLYGNACTGVAFVNNTCIDIGYRAVGFSGVVTQNNTIAGTRVYGGHLTGPNAGTDLYYFVFYASSSSQSVTSGSRGYNNTVEQYPWILTNGTPIGGTAGATGENQRIGHVYNFSHTSDPASLVRGGSTIALGDIKYYGSKFFSHEADINAKWFPGQTNGGYAAAIAISNASNVPNFDVLNPYTYPVQHYYGYFDSPTWSSPTSTKQCNTAFINCYFTDMPYDYYHTNNAHLFSLSTTGAAYFVGCPITFDMGNIANNNNTKGCFSLVGGCVLGLDLCSLHSGTTGTFQQSVSYFIDPGQGITSSYVQLRGNIFTKIGNGTSTQTQNVFFRNMATGTNTSHRMGWNIFWHPGVSANATTAVNANTGDYQFTTINTFYGITGATNSWFRNPGVIPSSNVFKPSVTGFAYTNRANYQVRDITGPAGVGISGPSLTGTTSYDGFVYNGMPGAFNLTGPGQTSANNSWNSIRTEASKPAFLNSYDRAMCVASQAGWMLPQAGQPFGEFETLVAIPGLASILEAGIQIQAPRIASTPQNLVSGTVSLSAGTAFSYQIDVADIRGMSAEYGSISLQATLPSWLTFTTPFKRRVSDPFDLNEYGLYYAVISGTAATGGSTTVSLTASNYYNSSNQTFTFTVN